MSSVHYNPGVKKVVDSILMENPSVAAGKMFGFPAYYINRKLFACVYEEGVGLKVPENIAKELIGKKGITHFQPLGRPKMKEWIQINRESPEHYLRDRKVFEISINYVASLSDK